MVKRSELCFKSNNLTLNKYIFTYYDIITDYIIDCLLCYTMSN